MFATEKAVEPVFEVGLNAFAFRETPHARAFAVVFDREHHALLELENNIPEEGSGGLAFKGNGP